MRRKLSITIKDVAKKADVSIATVSHVLNKSRYVSSELIKRVNDAIEELGYYPNLLVGSLRNKKTYTIGLTIPNISNETFGKLTENIQKILFEYKYNIIICNTSYDAEIEKTALKTLLTKKVDGIIIIPTANDSTMFEKIKNLNIPMVFVDRTIPKFEIDSVIVNNFKGTYEAIKYLIGLGHKKIGYIDRKTDHSHSLEQKRGYKNALEDSGIEFDMDLIVRANGFDYEDGSEAADILLKKENMPTAIYGYYDIIAMGALRKIYDIGLKVPGDISVVGCDGMPFTNSTIPRLTTIKFPIFKVAKMSCEILLNKIKNPGAIKIQNIAISPRLMIRESTDAVKN